MLALLLMMCLFTFGCSVFMTELLRQRLLAKAIMDIPNDRSMHKVPVPRGGGLAVMGVVLAGIASLILLDPLDQALMHPGMTPHTSLPFFPVLGALLLLIAVSWIDDKKGLGAGLRLACHLIAAAIGTLALGPNATLFGDALPFWADRMIMIIGWGWFMNLYNFMDGIDGITGIETITVAVGAAMLIAVTFPAFEPYALLAAIIVGACGGFLIHNWHPAKIFLGDVGSVPLGFLIGFLLLTLATHGFLISALILPLYYLADSGITITRRALRGEKIWQAHRQHFYQRSAVGEGRHDVIVLWVFIANVGLIACGYLALSLPMAGGIVGLGLVAILLAKMAHSARKAS